MKENPQVVIGQLVEPHRIQTQEGDTVKIKDWAGRACWSFLRLVYGRKVDDTIKSAGREREDCQYELLRKAKQDRPLQFIMSSSDVLAVATLKHLLIEPRRVYETAAQILGTTAPLVPSQNLHGETFMLTGPGFAGIKIGYQVDAGDLTTRSAIRVGVFARVEMCFNPLSWLGVSGVSRFGIPSDYERVLRIQKLNELFPRLQAAITNAKGQLSDLEKRVEHTKGVSLSARQAIRINGALCMAYGLGANVIGDVLERYRGEPQTQYGLAMAQSAAAQHGEHRKTSEGRTDHVPQSLSTISGATLLIDVKTAEAKITAWLKTKDSPLAETLLKGKLP